MDPLDFEIRGETVGFGSPIYNEVMDFIHHEAQLLDDGALEPWLDLLTDDVSYLMPVRITRARGQGSGFVDSGYYDDTKSMLIARVKRYLESNAAWAEDPPSRTRRFVTNVRVWLDSSSDRYVRSNYLILRNRIDEPDYEILSAERRDLLRPTDGALKLAKRHVYCDQTRLGTQNLSFFV
jgi:3-phenylpropionate/cinnamic acid dioxygenase small subunit